MVGLAQACLDASIGYAKDRIQFGKPIASFQLIREKLADMAMSLDMARTYAHHVINLIEQGKPMTKESAILKLFSSEMATRCALEAIQIHGGYGYMKEYTVERYLRDAKLFEIGAGTSEIQRMLIAREVLAGR
jgi:alkylation response protein AidB-like acyl-CoA dehydrogenase